MQQIPRCSLHPSLVLLLLLLTALTLSLTATGSTENDGAPHSSELSPDTWEDRTRDRSVFVKFFAPWCGHCQDLAPRWNRLYERFVSHDHALIAQVDCVRHEQWCADVGITAFPTLLYGDPSQRGAYLRRYDGEKTYDALQAFVEDRITGGVCSPLRLDLCTEDERTNMELYSASTVEELKAMADAHERTIEDVQNAFLLEYRQMQALYDGIAREYELDKLSVQRRIRMIRDVIAMRTSE